MTLKEKLEKAWKNRAQIAEGFFNTVIGCNAELEQEAQRRLKICESNVCGYYDTGQSDKLVMQGIPGCTACGCRADLKVHCFSCDCSLKTHVTPPQTPLWEALWDDEVEKHLAEESYKQQKPIYEKNRQEK